MARGQIFYLIDLADGLISFSDEQILLLASRGGRRRSCLSRTLIGYHLDLTTAAIQSSVAPKTWACYSAAWHMWMGFTGTLGLEVNSPSEKAILAFIQSLMEQQFSYSYVSKTLAGISFFLHGYPACVSYFSVRQVLKGYRRLHFTPDSRRPISGQLLRHLCECY